MNRWLQELHRLQGRPKPATPLNLKTRNLRPPSEPSKPSFEGFDGSDGSRFFNFTPLAAMRMAHDLLRDHRPDLIEESRWLQAIADGEAFLDVWGAQAAALAWTATDLFGLHRVPENPHPSYCRLSRYDEVGLCWLLQGRIVVALTQCSAAIQNPTGNITTWSRIQTERGS